MLTHLSDVERIRAQCAGERSTPFGEVQASLVSVQPGAPTGQGAPRVDDGLGVPSAIGDRDHPKQDGPETSFPASHTHAHRADRIDVVRTLGEPNTRPSAHQPTAPAHESGPEGSAGPPPPSSERMSMRQPVSFAASRAFCPSLPMARDSW